MRVLTLNAAALLLGAVVAVATPATGKTPEMDYRIFQNYSSHSASFVQRLLTERVWVFERSGAGLEGIHFASDGRAYGCSADGKSGKRKWKIEARKAHGTAIRLEHGRRDSFEFPFYIPETGEFATEILKQRGDSGFGQWHRLKVGHIQSSWPEALSKVCPKLDLPPKLAINEKQTASDLSELRQQDPNAPIRHFPGAEMTGPGRTGLAASGGKPTTTSEEVWKFLGEQGHVFLSPDGWGRVFAQGDDDRHEVWGLKDNGETAWTADLVSFEEEGRKWLGWEFKGKLVARYPMGYPFPYLPTNYRHAAFQLTDALIEAGEPVALPWMPAKWKDFTFRADGTVRARRADGGPERLAPWRWTQGRLWVQTGDNREAPGWKEVAKQLGLAKPKLWTRSTPDKID